MSALLLALALAAFPAQVDSTQLALRTAADTSAPLQRRAAALLWLRAHPSESSAQALIALAQPYRAPWVVWYGALRALAEIQTPALANYWRDMLTWPRRPVREVAIRGLAHTGLEADREFIQVQLRHETDPGMIRLGVWADSILRTRKE